jgi:hypothetical protein
MAAKGRKPAPNTKTPAPPAARPRLAKPKTAAPVTGARPSDHFTPKDPPTATVGVRSNPPAGASRSVAADAVMSPGYSSYFNIY